MVRSLKKLLNNHSTAKVVIAVSDAQEDSNQQHITILSHHFELMNQTSLSYTLKRGVGSSSTQYESNESVESPFIHLSKQLQLIIMEQKGHKCHDTVGGNIRIDQMIRTLLRLLNDRVSSLWRLDHSLSNIRNSCHMLNDIHSLYSILDAISLSLNKFSIEGRKKISTSSIKSSKLYKLKCLSRRTSSSMGILSASIQHQLYNLQSTVLPKLILRIEKFMEFYISLESQKVCNMLLKRESFLQRDRIILPKRSQKDKHLPVSTALIDILERDLLKHSIEILTENNFLLVNNILSKIFNEVLSSTLRFILNKKFQFSQGGVYFLYAIVQKFQLWILDVKMILLKNKYCDIEPIKFNIILDRRPWIYANLILQILETGQTNFLNRNPMIQKNTFTPTSKVRKFSLKNRCIVVPEMTSESNLSVNVILNQTDSRANSFRLLRHTATDINYDYNDNNENKNEDQNIDENKHRCANKKEEEKKRTTVETDNDNRMNSISGANKFNEVDDFRKCIVLNSLRIAFVKKNEKKKNFESPEKSTEFDYSDWIALSAAKSTEKSLSSLFFSTSEFFFGLKKSSVSVSTVINIDNF